MTDAENKCDFCWHGVLLDPNSDHRCKQPAGHLDDHRCGLCGAAHLQPPEVRIAQILGYVSEGTLDPDHALLMARRIIAEAQSNPEGK